jgi:hypothetical protein
MDVVTLAAAKLSGTTARTNLAGNGGASVDITGWTNFAGTGGAVTVARAADGSRWGYKITWTTATSAVGGGGGYGRTTNQDISVPAAGLSLSVGCSVIPSRRQRLRIELKFYDAAGVIIGSTNFGGSQVVAAGARGWLTVTATVPALADRATMQAVAITSGSDGVVWQVGDTLLVSQVVAEAGATVGPFFNGSDPGCLWSGTANASPSTTHTPGLNSPAMVGTPTVNGSPIPTAADLAALEASGLHYQGGHTTGLSYAVSDVVYKVGVYFVCLTQHIAGTFTTDLAAGKWRRWSPGQLDIKTPPKSIDDFAATLWSRAHPPLLPLPLTTTYLASGFSLATQLGASPIEEVWDVTTKVTRLGCRSSSVTAASTTFQGNISNGSAARQPFDVEFILDVPDVASGKFLLSFHAHVTDPVPGVGILVDGRPSTANFVRDAGADTTTMRGLLVSGLVPGRRVVRLTLQSMDFRSIAVPSGVTITATAVTRKKVFVLGDSWVEGGSTASPHATWPHAIGPTLARLLGDVEVFYGGQGSTGYTVTPGAPKTVYGSSDRLTALYACAPDYVIVWGTQNDDATASSVQAAATALFSAIATNLAAAKVIVVGPVSTKYSLSGTRQTSTTGLKAAATGSTNVIGGYVIDPHNNNWISGDGDLDSPDGLGMADYAMHTDGNHPTIFGAAYYARRVIEEIVWLFLRQSLISGYGFTL